MKIGNKEYYMKHSSGGFPYPEEVLEKKVIQSGYPWYAWVLFVIVIIAGLLGAFPCLILA